MSHNLMYQNGRYALAYNAKTGLPWHKLGTPVNGCMTWKEAMEKALLNWTVSKRQLYTAQNGVYIPVESYGIFRDDNQCFLGSVGKQYTEIQNEQTFDFVDSLLENNGAHYDTAGALFGGERIFVSATIPRNISPNRAPGDVTNCYLMFETSHDGSLAATAKLTTVRVVCNNTLSAALSNKGYGELKVRHSQGGADKLNKAKMLFKGVTQTIDSLKEKFDVLSNRKIGKNESNQIMDKLFGKDWKDSTHKRNQVERIARLFDSNDNNKFPEIKGSAYSLVQSYTNWVDHERSIRKTERMDNLSIDQVRTQNAIFSGGDQLKTKALEIILEATKNSEPMNSNGSQSSVDNILSMVNA